MHLSLTVYSEKAKAKILVFDLARLLTRDNTNQHIPPWLDCIALKEVKTRTDNLA